MTLAFDRDGPAAPGLRRTAAALTLSGTLCFFLVSPMLLDRWGFNYGLAGGSALEKMHPGTWLILMAFACRAAAEGNPLAFLVAVARGYGALCLYLCGWALLMAQAMLVQKIAFTPLLDTFLMPALLLVLLADLPGAALRRLAGALHAVMAANALIALFEFFTGQRLTPFLVAGFEISGEWRATALLGHPLSNAALTGCYVLVLMAGGWRSLPRGSVLPLVALQTVAMVAFGGRAALVLLLLALALKGGLMLLRLLAGARVPLSSACVAAALLPLGVAVVYGAVEAGFFDRFAQRFVSDDGSASARLAMVQVLQAFPFGDILIGPDPARLATLVRVEGIEFGIESFWIAMILTYGLAASAALFAGLGLFCLEIARAAGGRGLPVLLYFFAVASTSVSLSSKTVLLGMAVALIVPILRLERSPEGAAQA